MNERFVVEPFEDRYRILTQQGTLLTTSAHWSEAFAFVRNREGRVHLVWERTKTAGLTVPQDFSASHNGHLAGRVFLVEGGFERDRWAWCLHGNDPDSASTGTSATKYLAVIDLEVAYTRAVANGHNSHSVTQVAV